MPAAEISPWYASILSCPDCGTGYALRSPLEAWCSGCEAARALGFNADFLPRKPRSVRLDLPRNVDVESQMSQVEFERPGISYAGPRGGRDATELLSILEQTLIHRGSVLDLGCGPRDQAIPIESLGHRYVGIDYSNPLADIRGDAHALPFRSESFDFIFSYAVLEHLHNPFLAMHEIGRVLKPGGTMCGTASLGEPFHNSYFHQTAWGLTSVFCASRFEVLRLWACWDTLDGLAGMGRYSKVIRYGLRILGFVNSNVPFLTPRKMKWPRRDRSLDELHRAASIGFVIRKPEI